MFKLRTCNRYNSTNSSHLFVYLHFSAWYVMFAFTLGPQHWFQRQATSASHAHRTSHRRSPVCSTAFFSGMQLCWNYVNLKFNALNTYRSYILHIKLYQCPFRNVWKKPSFIPFSRTAVRKCQNIFTISKCRIYIYIYKSICKYTK